MRVTYVVRGKTTIINVIYKTFLGDVMPVATINVSVYVYVLTIILLHLMSSKTDEFSCRG